MRQLSAVERLNEQLKAQLAASQAEVASIEARRQDEANRAIQKGEELQASQAQVQNLTAQVQALRDQVATFERRAKEEEEAKTAELVKRGPPPKSPEEVLRDVMHAFGDAFSRVRADVAEKAGVSETGTLSSADDEDGGPVGFDLDAIVDGTVPIAEAAEQYLRSAMEAAATAVEPARLEAVAKWRNELKKRRQLQDTLQELKGSIRVMCRVRPPSVHEGDVAVATPSDSEVVLTQQGKDGRKAFPFDHVFGSTSQQAAVFEEVEPVLESVLAGFNVCIFAYGQTGSGKTFTMEGKRDDDALVGINPRALRRIFELIDEKRQLAAIGSGAGNVDDAWAYDVHVSYLEIYNENLRDLLGAPSTGKDVKKKEAALDVVSISGQPVKVPGLTTVDVRSATEVEAALLRGVSRRSVAATKCNSESSRSHSIVIVTVTGRNSTTGVTTHGKLHLVDLAGSERTKKSGVSGQGMTEAKNINTSLSALGDVMAALQEKQKFIPYRNSKLTQLLADSLGGNSKTFMFVNVNPVSGAADETLCSLKFAARVRSVELGKASGKQSGGASLQELKAARGAEERALAELGTANARLAEIEREAAQSRDALEKATNELATERRTASEYRETEEVLKNSEVERQRLALAEERKRVAGLEAKLKEATNRLSMAEGTASAARHAAAEAERAAAEDGGAGGGAVSAQEAMRALDALRASASKTLTAVGTVTPAASVGVPPTLSDHTAVPLKMVDAGAFGAKPAAAPVAFHVHSEAARPATAPPAHMAAASSTMAALPVETVGASPSPLLAPTPSYPVHVIAAPAPSSVLPSVASKVASKAGSYLHAAASSVLGGLGGLMDAPVGGTGGLMDAPVKFDAPVMSATFTFDGASIGSAPPAMPLSSPGCLAGFSAEFSGLPSPLAPSSAIKRTHDEAVGELPVPGSTPSKRQPTRYTPAKLPTSANRDSALRGEALGNSGKVPHFDIGDASVSRERKVQFQLGGLERRREPRAVQVQPCWEELDEPPSPEPPSSAPDALKENALPRASAATRTPAEPPSTDKGAVASVNPSSGSKLISAMDGPRPSFGARLGGGAGRVPAAKARSNADRGSAISKVKNASQRRMSVASKAAMEANELRPRGGWR